MDYSSLSQISPAVQQYLATNAKSPPTEGGLLDRSVGYLLGAVPSAVQDVTSAVGNITGAFDGHFLNSDNQITPATSTYGKIVDFLGDVLPAVGAFTAGEGPVAALSEISGLTEAAPVVANAAKQAAGFGLLGASQDRTEGLEQGGIGGILGGVQGLPLSAKLPAAIVLGLLSKAVSNSRHPENPLNGTIQMAGNIAAAFFHGPIGKAKPILPVSEEFATPPPIQPVGAFSDVRTGHQFNTPDAIRPASINPTFVPPDVPAQAPISSVAPTTPLQGAPSIGAEPFTGEPVMPAVNAPTPEPPPLQETSVQKMIRLKAESDSFVPQPIDTMKRPVLSDEAGSIGGVGPEIPATPEGLPTGDWKDQLTSAAIRLGIGGVGGAIAAGPDASTEDRIKLGLLAGGAAVAAPYALDAAKQLKLALKGRTGEMGEVANTEQGSVPAGGGKQIGISNLDASVEKTISDAKMMNPSDPAAFIQKMRDSAATKGLPTEAFDSALQSLQKASGESGKIIPELNSYLTRAVVGGVVGGLIGGHYDTNGDTSGFVTGGLLGAAAAAVGPEVAFAMIKRMGKADVPVPTKGLSWAGDLNKTLAGKIEISAGDVIHGSTRVADRLISYLDKNLRITLPVAISRTLRIAEGTATQLLDTMDSSMRKLSVLYKAPQELKDKANLYLDGGSTDKNTGVFTPYTKDQFLQGLQSDDHKLYAQYVVAARTAIDGLQKMIASGLGNDAKSQMINDSLGKFITKSYKLFTRDNWTPEPATVDKLAQQLLGEKRWQDASEADVKDYLYSYIREVEATKGMYRGSASREGQSIDQAVLKSRKDLSPEWRAFLGEVTNPAERIAQTVYRLRPMAVASKYLGDLATTVKEGDMPHYFKDRGSLEAFKAKKLQSLQSTSISPSEKAATQLQLAKLDNFVSVESIPKYGELRGGLVSRNVWNTLSTFDSVTTLGSHPWMRSVAGLNMAAKLSNTALNPISFIRNVFQMPMMMMLGRASMNDVHEGWKILMNADHSMRSEIIAQGIGSVDQLKQEIFRDFETATEGKFNFSDMDSSNLSIGGMDMDAARKGIGKLSNWYLDRYRAPDNSVRIGTYLSAKRRIAEALGKAADDPEVIQKATDWTNRYTMDYGSVAPLVKNIRQIPGVNLYISYISEMSRISKNVMMDMIHGGDGITAHDRMYAAMPIAFLGALPEIMNSNAEANLSPQDRADWEKAKTLMPDYARTRYRTNIERDAQGNFRYTDFTPLIPTDFIHQTAKALATHDLGALAAVNPVMSLDNSPALNILREQTTGKDIHTQRDFRGFSDRVVSVAKEILPAWVSIGREGRKFEQAYTPTAEGDLGLTNLRTGQRLTPSDFWLPYGTALRSGSYNLSALEQSATQQAKQDIANNSAYLNDILKSNAAPEIKQRETLKFQMIQQQIVEAWKEKLGLNPPQPTE